MPTADQDLPAATESGPKARHVLAVFIGRFQPFHAGHRAVVQHAMGFADSVLILVGSAFRPRTPRNPLTYVERAGGIAAALQDATVPIAVTPLVDTLYDDAAWGQNVRMALTRHILDMGLSPADVDVVLTGYEKDKSSAYVRWFPDWGWNGAPVHSHGGETVSATGLRNAFYGLVEATEDDLIARYGEVAVSVLAGWAHQNEGLMAGLRAEALVAADGKARQAALAESWGFPIALNTVDAVVVCAGQICLIRRGQYPGHGLLALPGGFLEAEETGLEAVLREVHEETGLDLSGHTPVQRRVFDHPDRSERGWLRTEAFVFELDGPLPPLQAGDDAADAMWIPMGAVTSELLFEDHFDILETLLDAVPSPYAAQLSARRG